jgi:hypothetical protein
LSLAIARPGLAQNRPYPNNNGPTARYIRGEISAAQLYSTAYSNYGSTPTWGVGKVSPMVASLPQQLPPTTYVLQTVYYRDCGGRLWQQQILVPVVVGAGK